MFQIQTIAEELLDAGSEDDRTDRIPCFQDIESQEDRLAEVLKAARQHPVFMKEVAKSLQIGWDLILSASDCLVGMSK